MRPTPEELLTELDAFGGGVGVVTPDWLPEPFTQALGRYVPTALTPATPAVAVSASATVVALDGTSTQARAGGRVS